MVTAAAKQREYMAAWKQRRIALGLCISCANSTTGTTSCDDCRMVHRLRQRAWRQRPDEKRKRVARESIRKALINGKLVRPASCDWCHTPGDRLDAHHEDHARSRDVQWLCKACHGITRRKARAQ